MSTETRNPSKEPLEHLKIVDRIPVKDFPFFFFTSLELLVWTDRNSMVLGNKKAVVAHEPNLLGCNID